MRRISVEMISNVKTRGMMARDTSGNAAGMFIKSTNSGEPNINKSKGDHMVKVKNVKGKEHEPKGVGAQKTSDKGERPVSIMAKNEKNKVVSTPSVSDKIKDVKAVQIEVQPPTPIDMLSILSQITVKVPLSELLRIPEHKEKAIAWVDNIHNSVTCDEPQAKALKGEGTQGITSQIPPIYLDSSVNASLENIDPFFLSVLVNGMKLRNCMIDSGASNTVMSLKIMESLGLKVDTVQGRCCAMDQREVPVIGTINAMPYRLAAYPEKELTMSVLVVDIPPHYGMLLSRKWSAAMGGSLQCDLSYATFKIDD